MATEVLNVKVCESCKTEWTDENEWVMDSFACSDQQEYCLNCCGCPEHLGDPWYEPKKEI
jgi:hypothetical protein